MTDEQILEIAKKYLTEESLYYPAASDQTEWKGSPKELLEFARQIRAQSFSDGYDLAVMDRIEYDNRNVESK